jgi:hypothetical protein
VQPKKEFVVSKKVCDVPECGNEIPEGRGSHGGLELCDRCKSALYHWRKLGPKALNHYSETLRFRASRVEYVQPLVGRLLKRAAERVSEARRQIERASERRAVH